MPFRSPCNQYICLIDLGTLDVGGNATIVERQELRYRPPAASYVEVSYVYPPVSRVLYVAC